jgi:hypothetical protein
LPAESVVVAARQFQFFTQNSLHIGDGALHVTAPHVGTDHDAAATIVPTDLRCTGAVVHIGDLAEGDELPGRGSDGQLAHVLDVGTVVGGEANDEVEAALVLENGTSSRAGEGSAQRLVHVLHMQAVAGDFIVVVADNDLRKALYLLDFQVVQRPDVCE